jgi:hypothetical protein
MLDEFQIESEFVEGKHLLQKLVTELHSHKRLTEFGWACCVDQVDL